LAGSAPTIRQSTSTFLNCYWRHFPHLLPVVRNEEPVHTV
jgi:hypothetical protein